MSPPQFVSGPVCEVRNSWVAFSRNSVLPSRAAFPSTFIGYVNSKAQWSYMVDFC